MHYLQAQTLKGRRNLDIHQAKEDMYLVIEADHINQMMVGLIVDI